MVIEGEGGCSACDVFDRLKKKILTYYPSIF
jgi:hypothetical protein